MDSWILAVLGSGGVGKTALAVQFALKHYPESHDPTIEDVYRTQLVVDHRLCFIEVIDTAGVEEYQAFRDQWIRECQGFILVYSITSRYSFEYLEDIYQSMRRVKRGELIFMLVGTKCDKMAHEREVLKREGAALARQYGCGFIETSAKTTQNVDRLFINLVRSLRQTGSTEQEPRQSAKKGRKPCKCVIIYLWNGLMELSTA